VFEDELLEQIADAISHGIQQPMLDGHDSAVAVALRVVGVGDGARGHVGQYTRIVRLPFAVIAAAIESSADRVKYPRDEAAGAFVEVARILVQQRRKDGTAQKIADRWRPAHPRR